MILAVGRTPDIAGDKCGIRHNGHVAFMGTKLIGEKRTAGARFDHHRLPIPDETCRSLGNPAFQIVMIGKAVIDVVVGAENGIARARV